MYWQDVLPGPSCSLSRGLPGPQFGHQIQMSGMPRRRLPRKVLKSGEGLLAVQNQGRHHVPVRNAITPVRTAGNLWGSRIASVIGITWLWIGSISWEDYTIGCTYQSDTFEREDSSADVHCPKHTYHGSKLNRGLPNKQWEIFGVEQLNICNTLTCHNFNFASEDVDEASQDKHVRNQSSAAELREVSNENKG